MRKFISLFSIVLLSCAATALAAERFTGPWDLKALRAVPDATWGRRSNLVQELFYAGEPYQGKATRVFAYYGRPESGDGPFPAMLLVHGGGGKAFAKWAEHWAKRGYAALAMDLGGQGPDGPLPDGGPDQSDQSKFRDFSPAEANQMWTYHAVAAVLRGHAWLAAQKEVDPARVGITGISWGGYLTCIIAGLDDRLKVAVPVYGCGFLHENSCWLAPQFNLMSETRRNLWVNLFDPSRYLPGVACPILFLNGSNDFAYPMDSYRKSFQLVPADKTLSVKINLPHGHIWTFGEVDAFVDSVLKDGPPLARLSPMKLSDRTVEAAFATRVPIQKAELHYTSDTGPWQKRSWKTVAAEFSNDKVVALLPAERPLVFFVSITDQRGLTVAAPHLELAIESSR